MQLIYPSIELLNLNASPKLIERAGRICYKSEDKITEESADKFVKMLLSRGHESVIEHSSITMKFICDRGVSHELVRHRLCAFSQESTRYCNYSGYMTFIIPPWVNILPGTYTDSENVVNVNGALNHSEYRWVNAMSNADLDYTILIRRGWKPEQARSILPNSLKTEIVVTANLREWRHIFKLRLDKRAHPQMREVMFKAFELLNEKIPTLLEDLQ
jgi:thymidylate synthase (FAD)